MKELIEAAKEFAAVKETEKVPGEHRTLWEAVKNFEIIEEKTTPEKEFRLACTEALDHLKKGDCVECETAGGILKTVIEKFPNA